MLYLIKLKSQKLNMSLIVKGGSLLTITLISVIFLSSNAYKIVNSLYQFLGQKGYFSYALFTLARTLKTGDIAFEMSTRNIIHDNAWEFIKTNIFLGNGIGAFHDYYGIYTHNIILDILTTFGIVGILLFLILFVKSISNIFGSSGYDKVFGVLIFCLAIIPLWFSMNFFVSKEFWTLIMIGLSSNRKFSSRNYPKNQNRKVGGSL